MRLRTRAGAALALGAIAALPAQPAFAGTSTGPSTTKAPYVLPSTSGVDITSLLTVGDGGATDGTRMVGIPDGLGARQNGSKLTVLMNHELQATRGIARRHGQKGAFVSQWSLNPKTLEVESGRDFINPGVTYWDYPSQTFGSAPSNNPASLLAGDPLVPAPAVNPRDPSDLFPAQFAPFARFCSSSLTDPGQLYNKKTGRGYGDQVYFANEESGDEARLFGVDAQGNAKQLPRTGLFSWENTLAANTRSDDTVLMGMEDAAPGQLWVYAGTKTASGDAFDKAGMTNGENYVLDVARNVTVDTDAEFRATYGKGTPVAVRANTVDWDSSGKRQNLDASTVGLTLNRIEDGAFDPKRPNDFYFLTTEGAPDAGAPAEQQRDGGGLWRLRFTDVRDPTAGAKLTLLLDGSEAPFLSKPDNMDLDSRGNILIQEDPGGNAALARIVAYRIKTGELKTIAQFDPALFAAAPWNGALPVVRTPANTTAPEATVDEESSGIIDVDDITTGGARYLFDAQVHRAYPTAGASGFAADAPGELVEFGQLLEMKVDWDQVWDDSDD